MRYLPWIISEDFRSASKSADEIETRTPAAPRKVIASTITVDDEGNCKLLDFEKRADTYSYLRAIIGSTEAARLAGR